MQSLLRHTIHSTNEHSHFYFALLQIILHCITILRVLSTRFVTNKLRVSAIGNNRDGVANSVGRVYVGIHARAFVRAVSNGMQMSAGCIRSIAQRLRFPFFALRERNTQRI